MSDHRPTSCSTTRPITGRHLAVTLRELFERIFADPDDASGVLADLDVHLAASGLADHPDLMRTVDLDGIALHTLAALGTEVAALPPSAAIRPSGTADAAIARIRQLAVFVAEVAHAEVARADGSAEPAPATVTLRAVSPSRRNTPRAAELTFAERRVVALVAVGRSNGEIAEMLQVSRRTVESQVAAAYRKLGVSSRVQLALAAQDAGLVA